MTDRASRKDHERQLANYKPSHYSKSLQHYQMHTLKKIDLLLRSIAYHSKWSPRFPVYKLLRVIAKTLLLNQFQIIVMALFFQNSKWDITDDVIIKGSQNMGQLMCFSSECSLYRQLTLYMLLVGWATKSSLNQNCSDTLDEVKRICYNFKSIFQEWTEYRNQLFTLSPPTINRIYCLLTDSVQANKIDYHLIVDAILQISHAYNPDKELNSEKKRRSSFLSTHPLSKIQVATSKEVIQNIEANFVPANVERMLWEQNNYYADESMNVFGKTDLSQSLKFPGVFGSSMGGFLNMPSVNQSYKPDIQFQYFEYDLKEGDHHFMIFSQADPTLSSMLNMEKGISVTQKYLVRDEVQDSQRAEQ